MEFQPYDSICVRKGTCGKQEKEERQGEKAKNII